ncbi:hypothetical protein LBMAG42_08890 [Deltaproteobacteria bacterium]|nr:hypothetical protein LBMAG42_08890 [Deltaproteobacteria bacterium]
MSLPLIIGIAVFVFWILMEFKTSRPDGTLMNIPPYRRIMQYLMPTRNESVVYFESYLDATNFNAWVEKVRSFEANITHATVAAIGIGLSATPAMNRFVMGRRLYARNGRWLTFSMLRTRLNAEAKIGTVKREFIDGESFKEWTARVNGGIKEERSGTKTSGDKELDLFNLLPRPLLMLAASAIGWMNHYNILPGFFIKDDPMHTSIFVANLGSLNMAPGYHHLFEYGTCPLFIMVGKTELGPMVVNGELKVVPRMHLRFSFDERIDHGLATRGGIEAVLRVLGDPQRYLGCTADDGSDVKPMWPNPEWDKA